MTRIDEREFQQHPVAVITVEALRPASDLRPGGGQIEFEWFNNVAAANEWATQFGREFAALDGMGHFDDVPLGAKMRAHLIIVVADTQTKQVTRATVFPQIRETKLWRDQTVADLSVLFDPDPPSTRE